MQSPPTDWCRSQHPSHDHTYVLSELLARSKLLGEAIARQDVKLERIARGVSALRKQKSHEQHSREPLSLKDIVHLMIAAAIVFLALAGKITLAEILPSLFKIGGH